MKIVFSMLAWGHYLHWRTEPETLARINTLIQECARTPFAGTGRPEPLKGELKGWSRRINLTDRLVYRISGKSPDQTLEIVQCRFHYDR